MKHAPIPSNEERRLKAVKEMKILDTEPEERFERLVQETKEKLKVDIAAISIIDKDREWFKACQGCNIKEGSRATSFCGHAMLAPGHFYSGRHPKRRAISRQSAGCRRAVCAFLRRSRHL